MIIINDILMADIESPSKERNMKYRVSKLTDEELFKEYTISLLNPEEYSAGRRAHLETETKKREQRKKRNGEIKRNEIESQRKGHVKYNPIK